MTKSNSLHIVVKHCESISDDGGGCPFFYDGRCDHPGAPEELRHFGSLHDYGRFSERPFPNDCPLQDRDVLVSRQQAAKNGLTHDKHQ